VLRKVSLVLGVTGLIAFVVKEYPAMMREVKLLRM